MRKPPPPPVYRSPSGRYFLWSRIVRDARRTPGVWFLALPAVPLATVRAVREQRHVDLKLEHGRLEAQARNPYIHQGRNLCDLFVRYMEE